MARVIVSGPAQRDIQAAHDWWKANRSVEQANRWYEGIYSTIKTLHRHSERCPLATENDLLAQGIRQQLFGLGRRATQRILFTSDGDTIVVLRVRHAAQNALTPDDLHE